MAHAPVLEAIDQTQLQRRPPFDVMYEWVSTVDHKKIGLMYIAYALMFLAHRGLRSGVDTDSACSSQQSLCVAAGFQPTVHDAWHDDGVLRGDADPVWVRKLSRAAHDWRTGHGVSAVECVQLLDIGVWWFIAVLQLSGWGWALWGRVGAGCRLVCLCSADGKGVLAGAQHGLLDAGDSAEWHWNHGYGTKHRDDHNLHALQRDEVVAHAAVRVADAGDERPGLRCGESADGGADHADAGPLYRSAFL